MSADHPKAPVVGYQIFEHGEHFDFQIGFDLADGDRKAGFTSRPLYAEPPVPAVNSHDALVARVAALEAYIRHAIPLLRCTSKQVTEGSPAEAEIDGVITGLRAALAKDA